MSDGIVKKEIEAMYHRSAMRVIGVVNDMNMGIVRN